MKRNDCKTQLKHDGNDEDKKKNERIDFRILMKNDLKRKKKKKKNEFEMMEDGKTQENSQETNSRSDTYIEVPDGKPCCS